ncbi:hypothetical protein GCM10009682_24870 [Luedemannella flava]|uniref:Ig-like domain-containing protein n=1 Tax=Luedemannella flava TaxID=349316 RepID=A0ABP4Y5B2_9ACTN
MRVPRIPVLLRGLAGVAAAALMILGPAAPAYASGVWIQVTPSTVNAGYQAKIKASCEGNTNDAQVHSKAFGTVVVKPENGTLTATVTVPESLTEGGYDVTLTCPTGSTATTTVWVLNHDESAEEEGAYTPSGSGPHTGGGFLAGAGDSAAARAWLAVGAGALVAGVAFGVHALRRRTPARTR